MPAVRGIMRRVILRISIGILQIVSYFVSFLSFSAVYRLGKVLGHIWFYAVRIRRRDAISNLQKVFVGDSTDIPRIARESLGNTCANAFELMKMIHDPVGVFQKIEVVGLNHYHNAFEKGRGVLVVTGHFGNFDLLACSQAFQGIPLGIVSKVLRSGGLNQFWMKCRRNSGLKIFEEGSQAKAILRWLRSGNVLGLVVDQRLSEKRGGKKVPFFGYDVWTSTSAARLARHTGAVILPVVIHRVNQIHHRIIVEPPLFNDKDKSVFEFDDSEIMKTIHQRLEYWILCYPEQWMWIHRRFKNSKKTTLL